MRTKKNTRVATWLSLVMGFAAATSAEAATTAFQYTGNVDDSHISTFHVDLTSGPYLSAVFSGLNLLYRYGGDDGGLYNTWTRGTDNRADDSYYSAGFSKFGGLVNNAVAGNQNYALFETSDHSLRYVIQMNLSTNSATPVAWAKSDISGFNIAAGKAAIDALGTSAVPEASTSLGLLALGAGGLLTRRRQKRKA